MTSWLQTLVPSAIGAAVASVTHLIGYGRVQQRQDDHEDRINKLEENQVTPSVLEGLKELMEAKFNGMTQLFNAKFDALSQRLDTVVIERRVVQAPVDTERRQA